MSSYVNKRLSHRVGVKKLSLRVGVKKLTTIVKNDKGYETVPGDNKPTTIGIKIVDISTGGLCIESKYCLKEGMMLELEIPKIATLDGMILTSKVTRSIYIQDSVYHVSGGTDEDSSHYQIGLKSKNPNDIYYDKYMKQLLELVLAKII